jgi:hypothetical protein
LDEAEPPTGISAEAGYPFGICGEARTPSGICCDGEVGEDDGADAAKDRAHLKKGMVVGRWGGDRV